MKPASVQRMTVQELVDRFVQIALAQDEAVLHDKIAKYNRLYGEMDIVENELKSRPGDARRALVEFFGHPNAQVRLKAATAALAVAPDAARRTLQMISDLNEYPQAADARGMMSGLDDGSYTPT
jgi:Domain of unknown function (DUF2019)